MTLYVYCPRASTGAHDLAKALESQRLRRFDGLDFWFRGRRAKLSAGDIVICWGSPLPEIDGLRILNGHANKLNKLEEWRKLYENGIPSVVLYTPRQVGTPERALKIGAIGRSLYHQGGLDLLNGVKFPDYYTVRQLYSEEYRVHSFGGKSIRAGVKIPREGFREVAPEDWLPNRHLIHPWIRSFEGGWRIKYDGFQSVSTMRTIAHKAVKVLGLTFGAVDLAKRADNGYFEVLEVNRAPGIEDGSIAAYVKAITNWINRGPVEESGPELHPF